MHILDDCFHECDMMHKNTERKTMEWAGMKGRGYRNLPLMGIGSQT